MFYLVVGLLLLQGATVKIDCCILYESPLYTLKSNLGNHNQSSLDETFLPLGPDGRPDPRQTAEQGIREIDEVIRDLRNDGWLSPAPSPSPSPSPPPRRSGNNAVNTLYLYECPTYPYNLI